MTDKSLSKNLASTVVETGSIELPAEILEFSIDQVLDDSVLKDIPFVGWIAKGLSVSQSISDRIFHHKILRFLYALEDVSSGDKEKFQQKMDSDSDYRDRVGEHLILLLNRIDSLEKTKYLAICFDHLISGHIDYQYFVDLSNVIERSMLSDLKELSTPANKYPKYISPGVAVASGILEFGINDPMIGSGSETPRLGTRLSIHGEDLKAMFDGSFRGKVEHRRKFQERYFKEE
ncbi:MAG: hypothetical protein MRY76_14455 [Pseudomonadales bacterium]|nr:hypothetical protein [Pseudomonadales bacterium]